jgi:hypothetical protein
MVSYKQIEKAIEAKAPLSLQEEWDNSGWQVRLKTDFNKILLALEIRSDVIEEAVKLFREKKEEVWDMLAKRAMSVSYGWDKSAQNYIDMYKEVIAAANPNAASAVTAPAEADAAAEEAPVKPKATRKPRTKKATAEGEEAPKPARKPRAKKADAEAEKAEATAEAPAKPARKPRAKKAAVEGEEAPKPARKPRAKKAAEPVAEKVEE